MGIYWDTLRTADEFRPAFFALAQLIDEPAADPEDEERDFSTEQLIEYYLLCLEVGIDVAANATMPDNEDEAHEVACCAL